MEGKCAPTVKAWIDRPAVICLECALRHINTTFRHPCFAKQWSPNSVPYLMTFWAKMVPSINAAKQDQQDFIQRATVDLSRAYLKSRLECAQAVVDGEVDGRSAMGCFCNYLLQ